MPENHFADLALPPRINIFGSISPDVSNCRSGFTIARRTTVRGRIE